MNIKIACPKCDWEPDGGDHWQCTCGHLWNTFDTGGKCPKCGKEWKHTQCPLPFESLGGCGAWSPHIDWYKNLSNEMKKEAESAFKTAPKKLINPVPK